MEPGIGRAVLNVDGDLPCMPEVDADPWSPSSPREEVVQAPQQTPPAWQGPPAHL